MEKIKPKTKPTQEINEEGKIINEFYSLEIKDYLLITAINELTKAIKQMTSSIKIK